MKKYFMFIFAFTVCVLVLVASVSAETVIVLKQGNLRETPSKSGKIIGKVTANVLLEKLETSDGWLKVKSPNGQTGWVHGSLIKVDVLPESKNQSSTTVKQKEEEKSVSFKTIKIGNQLWMAENLNVKTFRNGDPISEVKSNMEWQKAYNENKAAWSYYNNDPAKDAKYGKLYNWYAVNDRRGLAPKGWHIPTNKEWQTLIAALGGQNVAFSKLTSTDGFAAVAGGERYYKDCSFYKIDEIGFWWTSTKQDSYNAWYQAVHFGLSQVGNDNGGMNTGFSVRCIKD